MDLTLLVHWLRVQPKPVPEKPASLKKQGLAFFVGGLIRDPVWEQADCIVSNPLYPIKGSSTTRSAFAASSAYVCSLEGFTSIPRL